MSVCHPFGSDTAEGIKKLAAGRQIAFVGETKVNLILRRELKEYRGNCKNVLWILRWVFARWNIAANLR